MKRQTKKYKHTQKLLKFFLLAQISALLIAAVIVAIVLIPNNFKQQHLDYKDCLEKYKSAPADELAKLCPEPYTK